MLCVWVELPNAYIPHTRVAYTLYTTSIAYMLYTRIGTVQVWAKGDDDDFEDPRQNSRTHAGDDNGYANEITAKKVKSEKTKGGRHAASQKKTVTEKVIFC
jgi:hypothetical protein